MKQIKFLFLACAVEFTCANPDKPALLKPDNAKTVKGPTVLLDWSDTPCAQTYKVVIKQGSPQGVKFQSKGGPTQFDFTTNPVSQGKTYAWRVIAINSAGKTKSEWRTFQVK
jgi:hypothetical protein